MLTGLIAWNSQFTSIYNSGALAGKGQAISLDRLAAAEVEASARQVIRGWGWIPRPVWVVLYDNLKGVWLDEGPRSLRGFVDVGDEPPGLSIVGHGWSPPLRGEDATYRFSNGPRSWIRVPIQTPGDFEVTLRIRAAFDAAPVSVRMRAGDDILGEAPVAKQWSEVGFVLPAGDVAPGMNDLCLSYSTTPAAVIPGFQGRNAAVALDWVHFRRFSRP